MLGVDIDELDLGSRRKPVEWVIVAPPQSNGKNQQGERTQGSRRMGGRRNAAARARRKAAHEAAQAEAGCDPSSPSSSLQHHDQQPASPATASSSTTQPTLHPHGIHARSWDATSAWDNQAQVASSHASQETAQKGSCWVAHPGLHGSSPKNAYRQRYSKQQQKQQQQQQCTAHLRNGSDAASQQGAALSGNMPGSDGKAGAAGSSSDNQPVLSNGKQRDDPGMFDEASIPCWTRDDEGAPTEFEQDLLVPERRLLHAQASTSASAALPGFNDLGLLESGQVGSASSLSAQSGFSPLSPNGSSQGFALGPPGSGAKSPFHPFDVVRQMSSSRASADSEKGRRSTGSQAFGEGSGELEEGHADGMDYIAAEDDDGNVEYKLRLKNPSPVRFQQLVTQLKFRLSEGSGECYYYLGVQDDGKLVGLAAREQEISAAVLAGMAAEVGATSQLLQQLPVGLHRAALYVRVRRASVDHLICSDLCVAVAGAVDSGKSTLVAALTHGCEGRPRLDDGQGAARMAVLRHKHEIESGRTSSISQQLLGYDDEGRVLNYGGVAALTAAEIGVAARKVVHFLDLGGHAKFLKTALYGLTCLRPDYMLLCVEMGLGLEPAAREHLAVALALRIPVALLLTKADLARPGQLPSSLASLRDTILAAAAAASSGGKFDAGKPDAEECAPFLDTEAKARSLALAWSTLCNRSGAGQPAPLVVPIFPVSCVSGMGLAPLHAFLAHLNLPGPSPSHAASAEVLRPSACAGAAAASPPAVPPQRTNLSNGDQQREVALRPNGVGLTGALQRPAGPPVAAEPCQVIFQVDNTFEVRGVGSVVSGMVLCGQICVGAQLLMGPTDSAAFTLVKVTCIQRCQVSVGKVEAGERATLAIHSMAEAHQGAATSTPDVGSSVETRAVWRPCIPDNPYDHPLIVPSSPQASPGTSPLRHHGSSPSRQAFLHSNGAKGMSSAACLDDTAGLGKDMGSLQNRLHLRGSPASAEGTASASSPLPSSLPNLQQQASGLSYAQGPSQPQQPQQPNHSSTVSAAASVPSDCCSSRSTSASEGQDQQGLLQPGPSSYKDGQAQQQPSAKPSPHESHAADAHGSSNSDPLPQEAYQIPEGACKEPQQQSSGPADSAASLLELPSRAGQEATGEMEWLPGGLGSSFENGVDDLRQSRSPPPPEASPTCPLNPPRKGAVLIDADAEPRVAWEFEALLVLLSGHWPARGLLSGHWPPIDRPDGASSLGSGYYDSGSDSAGGGSWNDRPRVMRTSSRASKRRSTVGHGYAPVVHCGSVRQAARVVAMQEVARAPVPAGHSSQASQPSSGLLNGTAAAVQQGQACSVPWQPVSVPLGPAFAAAAVLTNSGPGTAEPVMQGTSIPTRTRSPTTSGPVLLPQDSQGAEEEASKEAHDVGCVARVTLRFLHHPEWLQEDARIIVRDRTDGCTSGAGVLQNISWQQASCSGP